MFYRDSSSIFYLFFRQLSELPGRNSTRTGHMLKSEWDLKNALWNLWYLFPLQIVAQKPHFFPRFCNVVAIWTAFGTKHDVYNRESALGSTRGSYIVSKFHEVWSTNSTVILPTLCIFCILFFARLCRWISANGTQPNFATWEVNKIYKFLSKIRGVHPKKLGS